MDPSRYKFLYNNDRAGLIHRLDVPQKEIERGRSDSRCGSGFGSGLLVGRHPKACKIDDKTYRSSAIILKKGTLAFAPWPSKKSTHSLVDLRWFQGSKFFLLLLTFEHLEEWYIFASFWFCPRCKPAGRSFVGRTPNPSTSFG